MGTRGDQIEDLARYAVAEVAPDEVDLLPLVLDGWRRGSAVSAGDEPDEPLGFGLPPDSGITSLMIAPLAVWAIQRAVTRVAQRSAPRANRALSALARRLERLPVVGRVLRTRALQAPAVALDPAEISHVRTLTLENAQAAGLPVALATLLADAVAGRLANAPT